MNLLFYSFILTMLEGGLTATVSNNEISMVVDVINSYNKPTSVALHVCWKITKKRHLIFLLKETPRAIQFIDSVIELKETTVKNDLLIIIDASCAKGIKLLEEGNKFNMFTAPYRWLILNNSSYMNDTILEIKKYNMLIDSEIVLSEQNGKSYVMRIPYKIQVNSHEVTWEEFGTWVPGKGLIKQRKILQPLSTRRKNLIGMPIVTSFVITDNSTKREINSLKNSHIDILSKTGYLQISHLYYFMNATNVNIYSDTWGYLINETWTGMIGSIVKGEAELTGTVFFITTPRLQVLDFLSSPSPPTVKFVFRDPSSSYQNNLFLLPFKPNVWLCILLLIFILAIIIFATAKWEKEKIVTDTPDETILRPNLSDIAIMIIGAISQQGSSTELKGSLGRLVMLILFIAFVFLYTSYSANIIVLLQSTSNEIRTLTDLYNSKFQMGSEDTPYNRHLFSTVTDPIRMAIYQNKIAPRGCKPNFMTLEEGVKKIQTEPFAFHMNLGTGYKAIKKFFYEHEKCGLQEIQYFQENHPWLACRKRSPYKEIYKTGLLRIQEHGLNDRENRLVYAKKPICSVHGGIFMSVTMTDFYPALLLLLYGVLLSFVLLLLEIFYQQRSRMFRYQEYCAV